MADVPNEQKRIHWVMDWLVRQGPAEWHGFADTWNWGDGCAPLAWIVSQPDCDSATAANIFWLSEPDYYLAPGHEGHEIAVMDRNIIARWNAGLYRSARFNFGGDYMDDFRPETAARLAEVPRSLAEPIAGGEPYPGFDDGLPVEIDIAWREATGDTPPAWWLAKHGLQWENGRCRPNPAAPVATPEQPLRVERAGKMSGIELRAVKQALAEQPRGWPGSPRRIFGRKTGS
jgi:hypothetical protein